MKFVLLMAQLALCGLLLAFLLAMFLRERRSKRLQNALLDELQPGFAPQQRWFRINLARLPFFSRRMRVFGFEAKGLLIDQGETVKIVAMRHDGERIEHVAPKRADCISWRGNSGLRSANLHWLQIGAGSEAVMVAADTGMNAVASREATADLMRSLLPQQALDDSALRDFAFEKHPLALFVVAAALLLLIGALADVAITEHQLLQPRNLRLLGLLVSPLGLLIYPVLLRHRVPSRESLVLSMLVIVALSIAVPGAVLRLDQWLSGGAVATPYRLAGGARLEPVKPGTPAVTLNDIREYWAQFEPGSIHELGIVHGPLGLWQLDRSRLNAVTREWYRREDAPKPAASRPASTAPAPPR